MFKNKKREKLLNDRETELAEREEKASKRDIRLEAKTNELNEGIASHNKRVKELDRLISEQVQAKTNELNEGIASHNKRVKELDRLISEQVQSRYEKEHATFTSKQREVDRLQDELNNNIAVYGDLFKHGDYRTIQKLKQSSRIISDAREEAKSLIASSKKNITDAREEAKSLIASSKKNITDAKKREYAHIKQECDDVRAELQLLVSKKKGEYADFENFKKECDASRKKYKDFCSRFESLTGVNFKSLMNLVNSMELVEETHQIDYNGRVESYITRLKEKFELRKDAIKKQPLLSAVAPNIENEMLTDVQRLARLKAESHRLREINNFNMPEWSDRKVPCEILNVVDGDTFHVLVDGINYTVRTVGYDTPETCNPNKRGFEHYGIEATKKAQELISQGNEFVIYLDPVQLEDDWITDHYGRLLAHIEIDGTLLGESLLAGGFATTIDFFPMDKAIHYKYTKSELNAKTDDVGMWKAINDYALFKKANKKKKLSLTDIIRNKQELDMSYDVIKTILQDMVGDLIVKSGASNKFHKEDCYHVDRINKSQKVLLDQDNIKTLIPCKHCHGDELIKELMD